MEKTDNSRLDPKFFFFQGVIEPFIPLIKAGEALHVGKGTAFGLGRYRVEQ